jgi:hypothetical protein
MEYRRESFSSRIGNLDHLQLVRPTFRQSTVSCRYGRLADPGICRTDDMEVATGSPKGRDALAGADMGDHGSQIFNEGGLSG